MSITVNWSMLSTLKEYEVIGKRFQEQVTEFTGGEVTVNIVKRSADPSDPILAIESGAIDIYQVPSSQLGWLTRQEWLKCWDVPFLFRDKEHVERYIGSSHARAMLKNLETDSILPLTYSYAGGFSSVLRKVGNEAINCWTDGEKYRINQYETLNMGDQEFAHMYASLPFNILMYEIHELALLKPEQRDKLVLELTNHHVLSRVTLVSKSKIEEIPVRYREGFLTLLQHLLDGERWTIYERSEKNVKNIGDAIKTSTWDQSKRDSMFADFADVSSGSLGDEIRFIRSLIREF